MFIATYLLALLKFQTGGNQIRISFSCNRQRHIPGGTPSVGHIPRSITLMVYFGEKKMFRAQYDSAKPTAWFRMSGLFGRVNIVVVWLFRWMEPIAGQWRSIGVLRFGVVIVVLVWRLAGMIGIRRRAVRLIFRCAVRSEDVVQRNGARGEFSGAGHVVRLPDSFRF